MILYFSATGNTRWAAEYISEAIGERLVNMADIDVSEPLELSDGERVGFCFPVHGWRPPMLVRRFVASMRFTNFHDNYVWALCSAGDDIGQTMEIFSKDLSAKGLELHSRFSIIMPESYVGLPFMDVDKPEKEYAKKKTAKMMLEEYVRDIAGLIHTIICFPLQMGVAPLSALLVWVMTCTIVWSLSRMPLAMSRPTHTIIVIV